MLNDKFTTIGRLFDSKAKRKAREERERQEWEAQLEAEEKERREKDPHCTMPLKFALMSNDYGWMPRETGVKRVILINPQDARTFDAMELAGWWRETGHFEWECVMALFFLDAVDEANANGKKHADISDLFNRDLLASRDRKYTMEQIFEHCLGSILQVINPTEDDLQGTADSSELETIFVKFCPTGILA